MSDSDYNLWPSLLFPDASFPMAHKKEAPPNLGKDLTVQNYADYVSN
jgi:hypothetical protein